ncbi:hypothetical protein SKDZ_04G7060 [Saccharomyces kudriavzevii ZP591]|uniref:Uncharacterized protein n=2 Tax=Saccharomyces kudriavzevii (strain ATCC MYA-4449 / AS 2.2408 / CBS 8840 / NBRC 1802 / NCYC 2889) TaxID=226230 RepID=A0AA35JFJ9_SACK1|nr:uncharacterized protein SKDI_04G7170 [Saccharomyces kudriavzevii IFO 1802]EJT44886.1 FPR2-like protein [Saccharomyces kudriavzevii IFO 1802]CAI4059540.1 hypothetical protein SKDZ_04G7060 [Saccharomyces kudriavzevii ZP591]CAI4059554.1 hypothetical protein SKDI_04G7170 [Saccharomyces kudriavzevii IFO 1802]
MLLNIYLLFTFFATGLAGSLTDLEIGVTKRIPVEECVIKAMPGDKVEVHYTGSLLESGTVFDSSYSRGSPIAFELGVGRVIKGWDQGIAGMCIGEKRKLQIPSSLAYGERGVQGVIPPSADLVFDVELVNVR